MGDRRSVRPAPRPSRRRARPAERRRQLLSDGSLYLTGGFPATTYALRTQAGARYIIQRQTVTGGISGTFRIVLSAREEALGGGVTDLVPAKSVNDLEGGQGFGKPRSATEAGSLHQQLGRPGDPSVTARGVDASGRQAQRARRAGVQRCRTGGHWPACTSSRSRWSHRSRRRPRLRHRSHRPLRRWRRRRVPPLLLPPLPPVPAGALDPPEPLRAARSTLAAAAAAATPRRACRSVLATETATLAGATVTATSGSAAAPGRSRRFRLGRSCHLGHFARSWPEASGPSAGPWRSSVATVAALRPPAPRGASRPSYITCATSAYPVSSSGWTPSGKRFEREAVGVSTSMTGTPLAVATCWRSGRI